MKGRATFTARQATEIRATLDLVSRARRAGDRPQAKALRHSLRAMGFYITDWDQSQQGFERSDFDRLVSQGAIRIDG
jgi:hypothetical protein